MAKIYRPGRSVTEGKLGLVRHLGAGEFNDDIYLHTAAKPQGWNLGDRRQLQDGRVFYLSKAYAAPTGHGTSDYGRTMTSRNTIVAYTTTNCQGGTLGEHTIKVTGSGISDGDYAGGFMYLTDATNTGTRKWGAKIVHNTASGTVDGVANTVIITLDGQLPATYSTSDSVYVTPPLYGLCHEGDGNAHSGEIWALCIGVLVVTGKVAANDYVWLQTWGPHAWLPAANTNEGGVTMERRIYLLGNGAMQAGVSGNSTISGSSESTCMQPIGYYMSKTTNSNDLSYMFFLTINP